MLLLTAAQTKRRHRVHGDVLKDRRLCWAKSRQRRVIPRFTHSSAHNQATESARSETVVSDASCMVRGG